MFFFFFFFFFNDTATTEIYTLSLHDALPIFHRASFLLYAHREQLRRVLVVGPNPAFMEYVSHVLPTLGEDSVDQRAVVELVAGVEVSRTDPVDVQRLKANTQVAEELGLLAEAATEGEPQELVVRMEG